MVYKRRRLPFKACRRCKALVDYEVERCPICSSTTFSDDWEGMVILVKIDNSKSADILKIKKPWRYAIKVR